MDLFKFVCILQGSRKLNFKSLARDCMSIMYRRCHHHIAKNVQDLRYVKDSCDKEAHNSNVSLAIAFSELEKGTCVAVQKLMTLVGLLCLHLRLNLELLFKD